VRHWPATTFKGELKALPGIRLKIIGAAIVLFWGTMTGLLVKRELPSCMKPNAGYAALPPAALADRRTRMGIYLGQRKVGVCETTIRRMPNDYYKIESTATLEAGPLRGSRSNVSLTIFLRPDQSLESFRLLLPGCKAVLQGTVDEDKLRIVTVVGSMRSERIIPYDPSAIMSSSLTPLATLPKLKVGKAWSVALLNPLSFEMQRANMDVRRRETILWEGREVDTFVIHITHANFELKAWVTPEGELLREQMPFGLVMVKEKLSND